MSVKTDDHGVKVYHQTARILHVLKLNTPARHQFLSDIYQVTMFREVFLIVFVGAIGYVVIEAQGTCNVNGQLYAHGQSWYVNCSTLCHCDLTAVHHVSCKQPCLDFSTLPKECSLSPPLPGMCCPQPHCPPSVTIEIPPEYASQYPVVG